MGSGDDAGAHPFTVSDEPFMLEEDAYLSGVLSGDRQFVRVKSDQPTWVTSARS